MITPELIVDEFEEIIGKPLEELLSERKTVKQTYKRNYKEYRGTLGTFKVGEIRRLHED